MRKEIFIGGFIAFGLIITIICMSLQITGLRQQHDDLVTLLSKHGLPENIAAQTADPTDSMVLCKVVSVRNLYEDADPALELAPTWVHKVESYDGDLNSEYLSDDIHFEGSDVYVPRTQFIAKIN